MRRLTVEKQRQRLSEEPRKTLKEREREKSKRSDGIIDLRIVLSARLIFVFYCFGTAVIQVKVIWIWAKGGEGRWGDRELTERQKKGKVRGKVKSSDNPALFEGKDNGCAWTTHMDTDSCLCTRHGKYAVWTTSFKKPTNGLMFHVFVCSLSSCDPGASAFFFFYFIPLLFPVFSLIDVCLRRRSCQRLPWKPSAVTTCAVYPVTLECHWTENLRRC